MSEAASEIYASKNPERSYLRSPERSEGSLLNWEGERVDQSFADALKRLEGEQLSSVEFLQDYVQLRFDGPCLSAYNAHRIAQENCTIAWGQPGYCDALCKLIAHTVQKATVTKDGISIAFDNGGVWTMSLGDQGRTGPEAFYFVDMEGNFWTD